MSNRPRIFKASQPQLDNISTPNYLRINQIINGILTAEKQDLGRSCKWMSLIGVWVMQHALKIPCEPEAGLAVYRLSGDNAVIFGKRAADGLITAEVGNSHCWVRAGNRIVDFSAPNISPGLIANYPVKETASIENELYVIPDLQITLEWFLPTTLKAASTGTEMMVFDYCHIASEWFKSGKDHIKIIDNRGKVITLRLTEPDVFVSDQFKDAA